MFMSTRKLKDLVLLDIRYNISPCNFDYIVREQLILIFFVRGKLILVQLNFSKTNNKPFF